MEVIKKYLYKLIYRYDRQKFTKMWNVFVVGFAYIKIIFLFTLLWSFFSGSKDPLMISCGVVAVLFTFFVGVATNVVSHKSYIIKAAFLKYAYILIIDVVKSSIQMVKIICTENLRINPGTTTMNVSRLSEQEKVLFANLITMTPGTFVIAVEGDNFLIHALNKDDLAFKNNKEIIALLKIMRGDEDKDLNPS